MSEDKKPPEDKSSDNYFDLNNPRIPKRGHMAFGKHSFTYNLSGERPAGSTDTGEIIRDIRANLGEKSAKIIENNCSWSSNFIPREGSTHHTVATGLFGIFTAIAGAFVGKKMASKGNTLVEIDGNSDNVHEFAPGDSYQHTGFGS